MANTITKLPKTEMESPARDTIADQGAGPVIPALVEPGTTMGQAPIVPVARLDVAELDELLTHETVLTHGVIKSNAQVDATIFEQPVCPRQLSSTQAKSRITHIAEMYMQWQGEIEFRLYVSKAIFQQTKIVIAFVPSSAATAPKYTANQLLGFHNRVVLNPSNDSEAVIPVPFIAKGNWLSTTEKTGYLVAKLLQPIVVTQATNTDIPWTLAVSARPRRLRFRYIVPPPLVTVAGDPSSLPNFDNNLGDTPVRGSRQLVQRMASSQQRDQGERSVKTPLVFPRYTRQQPLLSAMLLPRSAMPRVFDCLMLNRTIADVKQQQMVFRNLLGPAASFEDALPLGPPQIEDVMPAFTAGQKVWFGTTANTNWFYNVLVTKTEATYYQGSLLQRKHTSGDTYFKASATPSLSFVLLGQDVKSSYTYVTFDCSYVGTVSEANVQWYKWQFQAEIQKSTGAIEPKAVELRQGSGSLEWPIASLRAYTQNLAQIKSELSRIPNSLEAVVMYTDAPVELAQVMAEALCTDGAWTPLFAFYRLSFSCLQGPGLFAEGRCMYPDQKASTWSLYNWELKDRPSPVALVFKSSTFLLDYAKPKIQTPDGLPVAVDISQESGSRWLYDRDCDPDDAEDNQLRTFVVPRPPVPAGLLELAPPSGDDTTTISASVSTRSRRKNRHRQRLRRWLHKQAELTRPAAGEQPSVPSPGTGLAYE